MLVVKLTGKVDPIAKIFPLASVQVLTPAKIIENGIWLIVYALGPFGINSHPSCEAVQSNGKFLGWPETGSVTISTRVDVASTKGVKVPHSVEYGGTVGEPTFKVTLLDENQDLDLLDSITGEV